MAYCDDINCSGDAYEVFYYCVNGHEVCDICYDDYISDNSDIISKGMIEDLYKNKNISEKKYKSLMLKFRLDQDSIFDELYKMYINDGYFDSCGMIPELCPVCQGYWVYSLDLEDLNKYMLNKYNIPLKAEMLELIKEHETIANVIKYIHNDMP